MINFEELLSIIEHNIVQGSQQKINELIGALHPTDIAYLANYINSDYLQDFLSVIIKHPKLDEIIAEFQTPELIAILEIIQIAQPDLINELFSKVEVDDIVNIISDLPDNLKDWVLSSISYDDRKKTEVLLSHAENSAGRIMNTECFYLNENDTLEETFFALRESKNSEMIYYIFVTDNEKKLVGVVSLRDLLTKDIDKKLKEVMHSDVVYVDLDTDQEEVAKIIERYNFAAIPVVDRAKKLHGIITVDDIIDVIRSEATEDIMKLAGTNEEDMSLSSTWKSFKSRVPWLSVAFIGGLFTVYYIDHVAEILPHVLLLAFIPIIIGMGGNIGNQSATIIVRGLATGKIISSQLFKVLLREMSTALLLGLFFGILLYSIARFQFAHFEYIAYSAALGILAAMLIASFIGSIIPIFFDSINIDPAVATGPLVSTIIDNLGMISYLLIALFSYRFFT